jgi:hypothetical protein
MSKHLAWFAALTLSCSAHAATVSASIDGGTSYVRLGVLSVRECVQFMKSPAVIVRGKNSVAVDGMIGAPDPSLCHAHAHVALVSTEPLVSTTPTGITTWPLSTDGCKVVANRLLAGGPVQINDVRVSDSAEVARACSKRSNSVTKPL